MPSNQRVPNPSNALHKTVFIVIFANTLTSTRLILTKKISREIVVQIDLHKNSDPIVNFFLLMQYLCKLYTVRALL